MASFIWQHSTISTEQLSSTFSQTIRYHQNQAFANGDHVWINSWGHPEV